MFLAIKQFSIVRNSPQLIFNFVQLMIKLPCGLGFCLLLSKANKGIYYRILEFIGMISYELYLVHIYVIHFSFVGFNALGVCIFWGLSIVFAVILHQAVKYTQRILKPMLGIR